ncbi:organelle RRM domain-containing protein 2, mitochondrial-like [Durio zibethinus]|uniref:Organelle RRM domain-containing protein 2, mitochondrial-like n=1 Tax=Durio zibethinus TaxID=66656 RepID=A0A6P5ZK59_DURZI|nr:organelle RRM domain-containing protein 2, mitochondrial-like [Durio zibethinus]
MALRVAATAVMAARAAPRGMMRLFSTTSPNSFMPPPIAAMGNGEGTPGREQAPPSTNLFVSGLNKRTPSEKLREAFSQFGQVVDARVVTDRVTGYSKGFGFVRYASIEEAEKGRVGMDGKFLDGWVIFAEYARPRPERPPPQNMTNSNGYNSYARE